MRRRVVITGVGLFTPAGTNLADYWRAITTGGSVLAPISRSEVSDLNLRLGGEIPEDFLDADDRGSQAEGPDRALLLARNATRRALADAGVAKDEAGLNGSRIGLVLGTGAGPTTASEETYLNFAVSGPRSVRPRTVTRLMFNSLSAHLGIEFKLRGPQASVASACASSNMAMSRALDLIRYGRENVMLAGGVEMPLCRTVLAAWSAMRVCSIATENDRCCLPFDKRRNGIALAEGSGMFVFEELEHALARGAKIYAEVLGYGENNDGTHITQPDSSSQAVAMREALEDAEVRAEQVDYINAHGTGTDLNDACETQAIKIAFGDHAKRLGVSSTKSVFGHGLGASGALELPAILAAMQHQMLPPTANLREPDPRCDLDYIPLEPRKGDVRVAISNSFAFGGSNSVLVLQKYEGGSYG